MDDVTRSLIAVGASAAVNCRPCLQFHRAGAEALGIPAESIEAAMEIGLRVTEGANGKTREYVAELMAGKVEDAGDMICTATEPGQPATCAVADR